MTDEQHQSPTPCSTGQQWVDPPIKPGEEHNGRGRGSRPIARMSVIGGEKPARILQPRMDADFIVYFTGDHTI